MGSHASQLSQKDRWLVIEYIKVLQNGGDMPEFDDNGNVVKPACFRDGRCHGNEQLIMEFKFEGRTPNSITQVLMGIGIIASDRRLF